MDLTAQFKKGYKTSEFWLTIIGALVVLINATTGLDLDGESIIGIIGAIIAYVASRSYLKGHRVEALAMSEFRFPENEKFDGPPVG